MPSKIGPATSLQELAAIVSSTLEDAGILATLSGGGAVSVYTDNEYESFDLDFVTSQRNERIAQVLQPLGFIFRTGKRELVHPDTDYYVEFPSGPLSFGSSLVVGQEETVKFATRWGDIRIVTPTHSVLDRLAHFFAWNDRQALDQVVMIARTHPLDWSEIEGWIRGEGADVEVISVIKKQVGLQ